jgi:uncharacterized protein YecE (DUF72 family)
VIYVGTSGWQYRSWREPFYAQRPQRLWLSHYATRFPTVEVNNSFYMLPKETTFEKWRDGSPQGFLFVIKASRYITHIRRLRNAKDSVDLFWSRAKLLGDKLGPVLFQLPPNFGADAGLLREFLSLLPGEMRAAFEFRDDSWTTDEVLGALDEAGAAWVLADRPGWRVPLIVTGGWTYLRFHQGRPLHPAYSRRKLAGWADRMASLGVSEQWAFFNNDTWAAAPFDALALMELLEARGCPVARPSMGPEAAARAG